MKKMESNVHFRPAVVPPYSAFDREDITDRAVLDGALKQGQTFNASAK